MNGFFYNKMMAKPFRLNQQAGMSILEVLVAFGIFAVAVAMAGPGLVNSMNSREAYRVSHAARAFEHGVRHRVSQLFAQQFASSNLCPHKAALSALKSRLHMGSFLRFADFAGKVPKSAPANWQDAASRCRKTSNDQSVLHQCFELQDLKSKKNRTDRAFVEIFLSKRDMETGARLTNCAAYQAALAPGILINYVIYTFKSYKGRSHFADSAGNIWVSGRTDIKRPKEVPATFVGFGPPHPRINADECPASPDDPTVKPCFSYSNEPLIICRTVASRCAEIDAIIAAIAKGEKPPPAPAYPSVAQCQTWRNWCNNPAGKSPLDIKEACTKVQPSVCPRPKAIKKK